jgi:hypothetical protein
MIVCDRVCYSSEFRKYMSDEAAGGVRVCHDAIVTGRCIDCSETITGELGVRMIFPIEGPGLEILITDAKRNHVHPIARIELHLIPFVVPHALPLPPAGSA